MVLGEYQGQSALRTIIPNNIPLPVAYGVFDLDKSKHFYVSEFHDMRERVPKPQQLISVLKHLHQNSVSPTGKFGFPVTTYKGYFPLQCSWCDSWEEFFSRQFRAELIWEAGIRGPNEELEQLTEEFFAKVIPRLLRPLQTGGRTIKPTLCHGDLWQGNVEIDVNTHQLILYDSCAVYAHNECEFPELRYEFGVKISETDVSNYS
jgi:protein-ribulosamine 3-kinase